MPNFTLIFQPSAILHALTVAFVFTIKDLVSVNQDIPADNVKEQPTLKEHLLADNV